MGQKKKTGVSPKTIKWIWYAAFAPFALVALMLVLTVFGVFGRMPSFEELENPRSNLATEIYSEDGKVIGTFFVQNRSYVQYADLYPSDSTLHIRLAGHEVPPIVAALIATEDVRFRTHSGIDIPSLARVAVKTLLLQNTSQGGGSTITQQLAKNLFPRDTVRNRGAVVRKAKLVTSKFKEWITALKLEYNYTKEEIAAMYLNTVEFGSNAFGIGDLCLRIGDLLVQQLFPGHSLALVVRQGIQLGLELLFLRVQAVGLILQFIHVRPGDGRRRSQIGAGDSQGQRRYEHGAEDAVESPASFLHARHLTPAKISG